MGAATIHIIHDSAWVVVIFTLGMLVGYLQLVDTFIFESY